MTSRFAVIGPGRVGWALTRAAAAAGHRITGVGGGSDGARRRLADAVGARALDRPADVDADLVWLAVPDSRLAELAPTLRAATDAALVHTAGALPASALGVPRAGSFHPLRSFAGPRRDVSLEGCAVAIDADDAALASELHSIAHSLGMLPLDVPADGRPRYHAAAVLAGNASLGLLDVALRQLDALGVPRLAGARAVAALLASVAENVALLGPDEALSGPIRRGDLDTVTRNLAALDAGDPAAAETYRQTGLLTLDVARRLAVPPPAEALDAIERALRRDRG